MKIDNPDKAAAAVWFLAKERLRHLKDAMNCWNDIMELRRKWGTAIPTDIDPEEWVKP